MSSDKLQLYNITIDMGDNTKPIDDVNLLQTESRIISILKGKLGDVSCINIERIA